ncbi:MAG: Asp-tRNA(Asn)/Glu-tRNA(Gln) amidotransferase subunit GatB [Candidatus Altiarchaeota archaeon]
MEEETPNIKIGLEIHVPLATKQKLFCTCPTNYYEVVLPNTNVCEVCTGMPGSKPHPINERALESVVMISELLNCKTSTTKTFVKRKHYNYPDLPSGYQRTSEPIGIDGNLAGVGLWEVHMEEDPGRYDLATGNVDYNRSGVPLIEIVTAPDMNSPIQMREFLRELTNLLAYTGRVVDVGGVMRADVNISIEGGARVEIKNINSVRGAFKAVSFEIIRQKNMAKRGVEVKQETRGFNEKNMITTELRTKESAADYRYIPDPDIPPLVLDKKFIDSIELPETPERRRKRLVKDFGLEEKFAGLLVAEKQLADLFEDVAKDSNPQMASVWITQEVARQLNYRSQELRETKLHAKQIIELLNLLEKKEVTDAVAKKLIERVIDSGESIAEIVKKESLGVVESVDELGNAADEAIKENAQAALDYKDGKQESLNFLMGQAMKKMKGRAKPDVVQKLLKEKLK